MDEEIQLGSLVRAEKLAPSNMPMKYRSRVVYQLACLNSTGRLLYARQGNMFQTAGILRHITSSGVY
jgi:hypothetical protein